MCADVSNEDYFAQFSKGHGVFRAIVEQARDFVAVLDREHRMRYLNHLAPGFTMDQVIGTPFYEFNDPQFHDTIRSVVDGVLASGDEGVYEVLGAGPHGEPAWYETTVSALRDGDEVVGVALFASDITSRKNALASLDRERKFLRLALDVTDAIIVALDTDARITLINRAGAKMLGVDAQELLGQSWLDRFVAPEEMAMRRERFERLMAGTLAPPTELVDNLVPTADGSVRVVRWHVALLHDDDGSIEGMLSYGQDITHRRETEAALADREALLASVFAAAPVGIGVTKDRIILEANDRLCEMLGMHAEDLVGKSARILYPSEEEYDRVGRVKYGQIEQGGVGRVETTWVRADKSTLDVLLSSAPLEENGAKGRVAFTALDISEAKAAERDLRDHRDELEALVATRTQELTSTNEELRMANQAKTDFLAAMSHELRTPLNSILGFTGIILDGLSGPITEEQNKQLEMVRGSGRHLLELINDILDLSKIEAGRTEFNPSRLRLDELVGQATDLISVGAEEKGLTLDVSCERVQMFSDARALQQILLNLLSNAVKFTDAGSIRVQGRGSDGWAMVQVQDTGRGIPKEAMGGVFAAFQQVGHPVGTDPKGTGLGLAIASRLASRLGGALEVASEVGKGSVFTLRVPLTYSPSPSADD